MSVYNKGRAFKFGDDINTDYICASKHRSKTVDMEGLSKYLMEDIRPGFGYNVQKGDFIVAGDNFGCGSSREYAARIIKAAGIKAVIAKSFARIFYRNAINIGLPVIVVDTIGISDGDILEVDFVLGKIKNDTNGAIMKYQKLPKIMGDILESGGLSKYLKNKGKW